MPWLPPALISVSAAAFTVSVIYYYLYTEDKEDYLWKWGACWLLYGFRFLIQLALLSSFLPPWMLLGQQVISITSALFFIYGSYSFLERRISSWWLTAGMACMAWTAVAYFASYSFVMLHLPTSLLLGAIYALTGGFLVRQRQTPGRGARLTGWALIVWGIHKADYPFLRPFVWFAPWGYLLAALLFLVSAIGILLVYFEKVRNGLRLTTKALAESEERFRGAFDTAAHGMALVSPGGRWIRVNQALCNIVGYTKDELVATDVRAIMHPEDLKADLEHMRQVLAGEIQSYDMEKRYVHKDGHSVWVLLTVSLVRDSSGKPVHFVSQIQNITRRKEAEEKLRKSEARYQDLYDNAPDMFISVDAATGTIIQCNETVGRVTGYTRDEIIGRSVFDLYHPDSLPVARRAFRRFIEAGEVHDVELQLSKKDGKNIDVSVNISAVRDERGNILRSSSVWRDITDRKRAEQERDTLGEQLRQAQKMEAIGTLAGGIANDFNNILYVVLGYSEMATETVDEDSPAHEMLAEIKNAARRASDLVNQILAFGRKQDQKREPLLIQNIVKETMKLLRGTLPSTVNIVERIDDNCGAVMANATEVRQIVLNLGSNAYHAMRDRGGTLSIELKEVCLDKSEAEYHPDLRPICYVRLEVTDTGCGIDPETLDRIFEPYFTTKETGEGTGLGLAIVHGIVHSCGGAVTVDSALNQGTTFRVFLPLVTNPAPDQGKEEEVEKPPLGRGERLLIIDDEQSLARLQRRSLERLGYRAEAFSEVGEALQVFLADPSAFDLVITDQTMPKMTGVELSKELLRIRPDIPIILCTGHSDLIEEDGGTGMGIGAYLTKPIVTRDLARTVRELLDKVWLNEKPNTPEV